MMTSAAGEDYCWWRLSDCGCMMVVCMRVYACVRVCACACVCVPSICIYAGLMCLCQLSWRCSWHRDPDLTTSGADSCLG